MALNRGMKASRATHWDTVPLERVPRHKRKSVHASLTAPANDDLVFRSNRVKADLLNTEIQTARMFLYIALGTRDPASKERNIRRARTAYGIIQRGINLVTLTDPEAQVFYQNLKLLKSALANLQ